MGSRCRPPGLWGEDRCASSAGPTSMAPGVMPGGGHPPLQIDRPYVLPREPPASATRAPSSVALQRQARRVPSNSAAISLPAPSRVRRRRRLMPPSEHVPRYSPSFPPLQTSMTSRLPQPLRSRSPPRGGDRGLDNAPARGMAPCLGEQIDRVKRRSRHRISSSKPATAPSGRGCATASATGARTSAFQCAQILEHQQCPARP